MSRQSFLNRHKGKSAGYVRSRSQERELAARGDGKVTPGSGSFGQKGDIAKYNGVYRIEAKTTQKKSFSVTRDMIRKIEDAALPNGEMPAIVVEFLDELGNPEMEVAVVPVYVLDHG